MEKLEDIVRWRRLGWLGHVYRINDNIIPKQALTWSPADGKRKKGRPRKNWKMTDTDDLKTMEMDWTEAEQAAENSLMWRCCVAKFAEGRRTREMTKD